MSCDLVGLIAAFVFYGFPRGVADISSLLAHAKAPHADTKLVCAPHQILYASELHVLQLDWHWNEHRTRGDGGDIWLPAKSTVSHPATTILARHFSGAPCALAVSHEQMWMCTQDSIWNAQCLYADGRSHTEQIGRRTLGKSPSEIQFCSMVICPRSGTMFAARTNSTDIYAFDKLDLFAERSRQYNTSRPKARQMHLAEAAGGHVTHLAIDGAELIVLCGSRIHILDFDGRTLRKLDDFGNAWPCALAVMANHLLVVGVQRDKWQHCGDYSVRIMNRDNICLNEFALGKSYDKIPGAVVYNGIQLGVDAENRIHVLATVCNWLASSVSAHLEVYAFT